MLAGISVDYLVRLEQGRDRRPSAQVLASLADALRLERDERTHLRVLAACDTDKEFCPEVLAPARAVRPTVQALLDGLEPGPAFVLNRLADLLAWTQAYERLVRPLGLLDEDAPNLMRFTFADRRARSAYPDWESVAIDQVAHLRGAARPSDVDVSELVDDLAGAAGASFTELWDAQPVQRKRTGTTRVVHPEVGELRLDFETLRLPDDDEQHLVVYLAADESTAERLDHLAGRQPGRLRAVTG